jgi:hypothetical protein
MIFKPSLMKGIPMKLNLKPFVISVMIVSTPLPTVVFAHTPNNPDGPSALASPVFGSEVPQRHFNAAAQAFIKKDYRTAATEIRKATRYMHLESERASGDARQALDSSVIELNKLANVVESNTVKDYQSLRKKFAQANYALALAHRNEAADAWGSKEYHDVGYELKAAAADLQNATSWIGPRVEKDASGLVADSIAMGDKIISGATNWTRDQVGRAFEGLGLALNDLGRKIDAKHRPAAGRGTLVHIVNHPA